MNEKRRSPARTDAPPTRSDTWQGTKDPVANTARCVSVERASLSIRCEAPPRMNDPLPTANEALPMGNEALPYEMTLRQLDKTRGEQQTTRE